MVRHEAAEALGESFVPFVSHTLSSLRLLRSGSNRGSALMGCHRNRLPYDPITCCFCGLQHAGAIAEPWTKELLMQFASDAEPVVAESCIVALDMLEHEESGAFEYADTSAASGTC